MAYLLSRKKNLKGHLILQVDMLCILSVFGVITAGKGVGEGLPKA